MIRPTVGALFALVVVAGAVPAAAEPIAVRFAEGITRGFPVLRSQSGEKLAQGELVQIPRGDVIESRLVFRFKDGSLYDERVVFSQRDVFTLLSYHINQRGPSIAPAGGTRSGRRATRTARKRR